MTQPRPARQGIFRARAEMESGDLCEHRGCGGNWAAKTPPTERREERELPARSRRHPAGRSGSLQGAVRPTAPEAPILPRPSEKSRARSSPRLPKPPRCVLRPRSQTPFGNALGPATLLPRERAQIHLGCKRSLWQRPQPCRQFCVLVPTASSFMPATTTNLDMSISSVTPPRRNFGSNRLRCRRAPGFLVPRSTPFPV